jgi:hypothetical protein
MKPFFIPSSPPFYLNLLPYFFRPKKFNKNSVIVKKNFSCIVMPHSEVEDEPEGGIKK